MNHESMHNKSEPVVEGKNALPYPTRSLDPPITLVDRAREIELAEESIQSHVNSKLELIVKQIRTLQQEARQIIDNAAVDSELHRIKCNFEKKIGMSIHLYEKPGGEKYFSILSPREWGTPPHRHIASYTIKADQSFEKIETEDQTADGS